MVAACGQVICTKVRDGDKRIVRLKEGSARGRHVVIVDDLVQSGGTLVECQRLLKTQVRSGVLHRGNGPASYLGPMRMQSGWHAAWHSECRQQQACAAPVVLFALNVIGSIDSISRGACTRNPVLPSYCRGQSP